MKYLEKIQYEAGPYLYLIAGIWATVFLKDSAKFFGVLLILSASSIIVFRLNYRKSLKETTMRRIAITQARINEDNYV